MSEPLFVSASPVFEVDNEVYGELARDLVRLEIKETVDGLKSLLARFVAIGPVEGQSDEGLLYQDGQILDFGKNLVVALGPDENQRSVFNGYISGIEVNFEEGELPEVMVYAEDKLMSLRMTPRMRSYENMSDADIAEEIANEHGLAAEIDAEGPSYDVVQQLNMSDLAFLRERARLIQAEVWLDQETLYFKTRDRREGTELTLVRGNDIISINACADLSQQRTSVHVTGYDAQSRELLDESAGEDVVQAEVENGRSGSSILQSAFGERIAYRVQEVSLNSSEAADWARAEMLRRARNFVTVNGTTHGSPDMVVGSLLRLELMGPIFNGENYYVTGVRHTYDRTFGHRTQFDAQRATVGNV
jgi:phage protein D